MQDREHLSDRELVLAADDELGSERARVHLAVCAECKERAAIFEGIVAQVAQAHRNSVDSQLPSIARPRAVLRGRISETIAHEASRRAPRRLFAGAFGFAALTMVALASILTMRHLVTRDESVPPASTTVSVLPNRNVTPGAVRAASLEQVCAVAQEEVVKDVSPSQRERVFAEYGIPAAQRGDYEVDYLITPGLGGNDDIRNLWPEPYHTATWNAHVKDALEERLHEMVCSHQLDLAAAQKAIATDWIVAYQKYVRAVPARG